MTGLLNAYYAVTIADVHPEPTRKRQRRTKEPTPHTDDYAQYFIEQVRTLTGCGNPNDNDYSGFIPCPDPSHIDNDPSAQLNYRTGHVECWGCGNGAPHQHDRDNVAQWLGFSTYPDWRTERTTATVAQEPAEPAPVAFNDSEPAPSRFGGYPQTYHKRTVKRHHLIDVQSQKHAAHVAFLWEQLRDYLPDDVYFSVGDFQEAHKRYLAAHDIDEGCITMHAAQVGLDQLVAGGEVITANVSDFGEIVPDEPPDENSNSKKCNTVYFQWRYKDNGVAKFAIWRRKTRTRHVYQFKPTADRLCAWGKKQHYAERQDAYTKFNAPDNVQPEWCETPEQVEAWEQERAPLYDDPNHARHREQAAEWYDTSADWTDSAVDRILAGRFNAIDLQPQPLPNASAFLDAIRTYARDVVHGGEVDRTSDLADWTGRERSTEARARERTGAITVQNSKIVACEAVQWWQWDYGLAQHLGGGKARVTYRGEKSLDLATDDEKRRFEAVSEAKQEARANADPNKNPRDKKPLTRGNKLSGNVALHPTPNEKEVILATIGGEQFVRLDAAAERTFQLLDIIGMVQRIKGIVEFATIPQMIAACKSIDGVFIGLGEAFNGHCERWDQKTPENEKIVRWMLEIEDAINKVLDSDDPEPLKKLVNKHSEQWENGIKNAAAMKRSGHRPVDPHTYILGDFAIQSHRPRQKWTITAQGVIDKLKPLAEQDGYEWVNEHIILLAGYIATNDNERCREHLRYAYEQTAKHRRKSR